MTVPLSLIIPGIAAILFAFLMIFQASLYSGAICLLMVLVQIAVFFFVLGAQLLSFLQIMIYAGAVMVLIVIAIMAASPKPSGMWAELTISPWFIGAVIGVGIIEAISIYRFGTSSVSALPPRVAWIDQEMASTLFRPYALMTEIIGLLVLISSFAILPE